MELDLQELKKRDIQIQYLVFGFVRNAQILLSNNTSFWNISDLIIYIIMAFYGLEECFKHFNESQFITFDHDNIIKKINKKQWSTCYGYKVIEYNSDGVHIWRFEALTLANGACMIGIDEANYKWFTNCFCWEYEDRDGYGYNGYNGRKYNKNDYSKYGEKYKTGDTIEMILNLNDKTLSYKTNNASSLKAFKIKPTNVGYCMAVALYWEDDSIQLLSYNYTK